MDEFDDNLKCELSCFLETWSTRIHIINFVEMENGGRMNTFYFGSIAQSNKLVELSSGIVIYALIYLILFVVKVRKMPAKEGFIWSLKFLYICALLEVTIYPTPLTPEMVQYNFSKPIGSSINFNPFVVFSLIGDGHRLYLKHYLLNILLTIPAGFFIASGKKHISFCRTVLWVSMLSMSIELVQLLMRVYLGSSRDIDILDVFLNIVGGILGYMLFKIYRKIRVYLTQTRRK